MCVVTVNGAMDRDVSFTVRTALGNASGTLFQLYNTTLSLHNYKLYYIIVCFFPGGSVERAIDILITI